MVARAVVTARAAAGGDGCGGDGDGHGGDVAVVATVAVSQYNLP